MSVFLIKNNNGKFKTKRSGSAEKVFAEMMTTMLCIMAEIMLNFGDGFFSIARNELQNPESEFWKSLGKANEEIRLSGKQQCVNDEL